MKRLLFIISLFCISISLYTQELKCTVSINSDQVEGSNKSIFTTLQQSIEEYVNTLGVDYLTFDMVNEKLVSDFQKWLFEPHDEKGNVRSTRTVHNIIVGIKTILCWGKEFISKEDYNNIKDYL